jgi:hypothetical protein
MEDSDLDLREEELISDLLELQARLRSVTGPKVRPVRVFKIAAAAAIFLIFCATSITYWKSREEAILLETSRYTAQAILPGSNKAVLTLDDQQSIILNGDHDGVLSKDGEVIYTDGTEIHSLEKVKMLTLRTPNGGQYHAILPDGTKIWLNAASTIRYPSKFEGKRREIWVDGEVYMEVWHNPKQPFVVRTDKQQIEVLGTTFNIYAYADNRTQSTTLVDGSLRVGNHEMSETALLKPGQQAQVKGLEPIQVKTVDTEAVIAWREGVYVVNDLSLFEFGKEIERWYDVQVEMGKYKGEQLSAMIPRDVPLADVLLAITLKTGIKFKVKERRVTALD